MTEGNSRKVTPMFIVIIYYDMFSKGEIRIYIYIYNGNITKSNTNIRTMDIRGIFDHFLYDFWLVSLDIKDLF